MIWRLRGCMGVALGAMAVLGGCGGAGSEKGMAVELSPQDQETVRRNEQIRRQFEEMERKQAQQLQQNAGQ